LIKDSDDAQATYVLMPMRVWFQMDCLKWINIIPIISKSLNITLIEYIL
jgi:hypothetical protein